jgi:hypothetical protein
VPDRAFLRCSRACCWRRWGGRAPRRRRPRATRSFERAWRCARRGVTPRPSSGSARRGPRRPPPARGRRWGGPRRRWGAGASPRRCSPRPSTRATTRGSPRTAPTSRAPLAEVASRLGALEVSCDVRGARVVVDGRPAARPPLSIPLRVPVGTVNVRVDADGYISVTREGVRIRTGEVTRERFGLTPAHDHRALPHQDRRAGAPSDDAPSRAERRGAGCARHPGFNLFALRALDGRAHRPADRLGHGRDEREQWACDERGDESYAGSPSFFRFEPR